MLGQFNQQMMGREKKTEQESAEKQKTAHSKKPVVENKIIKICRCQMEWQMHAKKISLYKQFLKDRTVGVEQQYKKYKIQINQFYENMQRRLQKEWEKN